MNQLNQPQQLPLLEPCHKNGGFLFKLGKASIHAGSIASRVTTNSQWGLVINLTGDSYMSPMVAGYNGAESIAARFLDVSPQYAGYPELVIDWSDGEVPDITEKEWQALVEDLKDFDGNVLIHCMGGHGRTGTLLTILGHLGGVITTDPVKWVREQYCKKTVETTAQIEYLKTEIRIETSELPYYIPVIQPMTPLNSDTPLGPWWIREEQEFAETPNLSGLYRCSLCLRHKKAILMYQVFNDETGYCLVCHTSVFLGENSYE